MKRDFTEIAAAIDAGLQDRDTRPIHKWAEENIFLPLGGSSAVGRFNPTTAPHTVAVLEAIKDPAVRQVNILKPIQGVGTTAAEIGLLWALANEPGPAQINFNTQKSCDANWEPRLLEVIKSCPPLKNLIPKDARRIRKDGIVFNNGVPLTTQSATMGNLQANSIRYQNNDELWEWGEGLFKQADARIEAFRRAGTSKQVNASQGGLHGSEWFRICFGQSASFSEWHVPCAKCGKFHAPRMEIELEGGVKRYLMHWDKDGSRIWYECPHCAATVEDSAKHKAFWIAESKYVTDGELKKHRTFRWNAVYWSPWETLVAEYKEAIEANAKGVKVPLQTFVMKRMADFWSDDDSAPIIQPATFDAETTLATGQGIKVLTIDVQTDHLWCLVREWQNKGESRLLHWSRALTFSDAHEIAKRYGIIEGEWQALKHWVASGQQGPRPRTQSAVLIDTGGDRTQDVYDACWRYGWIGLKGASDTREYFTHRKTVNGAPVEWPELYDQKDSVLNYESRGSHLPLLLWSTIGAKNILVNLRDGKGARWEVPKNIGHDYMRQINSEVKEQVGDKWRWKKLGSRANHAWDCEAMQVLAASMAGIFKLS